MKKKKLKDPFFEREAEKYSNPIPSREYILDFLKKAKKLMKREEIFEKLKLSGIEHEEALRRRLRAMERDGQLIFTRRGGYGVPEKMDLISGRVIGHREGFGFLVPDKGGDDLFLSAYQMRVVMDGDKVLARAMASDRRGRFEGIIVEVLERRHSTVVGRFFKEGEIAYVVPSNHRIQQSVLIPAGQQGKAKAGEMVVAQIVTPPTFQAQSSGKVIEILGKNLDKTLRIECAVRSYDIPHEWPTEVLKESKKFTLKLPNEEIKKRVDLRKLPFVTIDGEDAKDFDDAVCCEKQGKDWLLYVAIADVSFYVKEGSALDKEAGSRGNSVYFPGHVVPMLPEVLSNELCSLKPEVDRFALVAELCISPQGKLKKYNFFEATIHSKARLTYTEVASWLEHPKTSDKKVKKLLPALQNLHALFEVLKKSRIVRGAIDFETKETRIIFGANGKVKNIVPTERNVAHRIIEECMLMTNVAAAKWVIKRKIPSLFRVHEGPTKEKLKDLKVFLAELKLSFLAEIPTPQDYAKILEKIVGRPDAPIIQTLLLRSLSQAIYTPENKLHFGLAFEEYAHFTSPIRRYPDLLLHRAIKHSLLARKIKDFIYDKKTLTSLGEHCSKTERRADEATREVTESLKCEYVTKHLGDVFQGIVTSVVPFGLFVALEKVFVDGLVHVTALTNDYYHFDPIRHRLTGERTGKTYRLGDQLKVRVVKVEPEERKIDLELA